jgi:hypothetical protein
MRRVFAPDWGAVRIVAAAPTVAPASNQETFVMAKILLFTLYFSSSLQPQSLVHQ